ncbi:extracellular solute-binding protein [Alphaproteobacteria bacterium]|nr:extracellular solute-binding protein [Alphaproteobacteria bacterium]
MHLLATVLAFMLAGSTAYAQNVNQNHALAMHGAPQLTPEFRNYNYASPNALQGRSLRQAQIGSFDSLNPFSIRGNAAKNIRERVFESLLDRHYDEPFALYGLLAESVVASPDRSSVTFTIRKQARFADGQPVTAADVAFSWELLRDKGRPNHRYYYGQVESLTTPNKHTVRFTFKPTPPDRELPLIIGLMPILPKHIYGARDIQSASLDLPVGSGPYEVIEVTPGAQVKFEKRADYWANALPHNRGRHNFTTIYEDYYRDEATAFGAFKAGDVDIWFENNPQRWTTGYNFPAAKDGRVIKENISLGTPSGLRAFVMNTRRPILADPVLRKAMNLTFDFQWINKILYGDVYRRTNSYFGNTELSASGRLMSDGEADLLSRSLISGSTLVAGYQSPESDGTGRDRGKRLEAMQMLEAAGYTMQGKSLMNPQGQRVQLEILVQRRSDERLALSWRRMLAGIGVDLKVRLIDSSQYQRRLENFDFDLIAYNYYASLSPGNEQAYYWGSEAADTPGSRNYAGIKDFGIDAAVTALTRAETSQDFTTAARALDRALMSGHYFIPLYHNPGQWVARWHYVEHPETHSLYGARLDSWWLNHEN